MRIYSVPSITYTVIFTRLYSKCYYPYVTCEETTVESCQSNEAELEPSCMYYIKPVL